MESDHSDTEEIPSSTYIGENQLVKVDINSSISDKSLLIPCENVWNIASSSRLPTSETNYVTGLHKSMSYINPQAEPKRQDYISSSNESFKKKYTKNIDHSSQPSFLNKVKDTPHYINQNTEYSRMKKIGNSQYPNLTGDNFQCRMTPTFWQMAISPDKQYVPLNYSNGDSLHNCSEDELNVSSSVKAVNSNTNVSESFSDTRSSILSDFNPNSTLLIENCLVSSSTGQLDSLSIPTIGNLEGDCTNFLYNPNLLESAVDSTTTTAIMQPYSRDNSEDEFHTTDSVAKFSSDGQIFQNEKYFIFDQIPNDVRLSQVETSDGSSLLGIPGSSGISRFNRSPQKFVKICEKLPPDKNLYCLQGDPVDGENCRLTLLVRDSVPSTDDIEICEGHRKYTTLNLNKLPSELYLNKKISANQEPIIFEEENFPPLDYPATTEEMEASTRKPLDTSQHILRDLLSGRATASSMINSQSYLRVNQQKPPYVNSVQCFSVDDIEMYTPKDMTIGKKIPLNDPETSSNALDICKQSSTTGNHVTESHLLPEDLSSPVKLRNRDSEESGDEMRRKVNLGKAIMNRYTATNNKASSHSSSYYQNQFETSTGVTDADNPLSSKGMLATNCSKLNETDINYSSKINKNIFESGTIRMSKGRSSVKKKPSTFRSEACNDGSKGKTDSENINATVWCGDCDKYLTSECNIHKIKSIIDKPVHNRPFASIPVKYMSIKVCNKEQNTHGVFTRKIIPRRFKFGPVEGVFIEGEPPCSNGFFVTRNAIRGYLDTSEDRNSNWMKFVRWAESFSEMNCVAVEEDSAVYFLTTVDIPAKKELKVGYSKQYSMKYGLQYIKPSEELAAVESKQTSWNCFECDEKFKSSINLEEHLAIHDKDGPKKKRRKGKFKSNRNTEKEPKERNCISETRENLDSLYECDVCFLCFGKMDLLLLHTELHVSEKSNRIEYKEKLKDNSCPACCQMFNSRNNLSHHVNSHSIKKNDSPVKKLFKCNLCYKMFNSSNKLSYHVNSHSIKESAVKKLFKCNLCYKSFEAEAKLASHAVVHVAQPAGDHPCNLCHRSFSSFKSLTSHKKFHKDSSLSEYCCPMCNKKFDSLGLMKLHIPEHNNKGVYTCPYCQKTFPIYHKIRQHIRNHHPETVHPCPQCGKTLSSIHKLKLHMVSHSDRRDFICDVCKRGFKRNDKLKEHMKKGHANIRSRKLNKNEQKAANIDLEKFKYKCEQCLRGFKRRGILVNHLSKRHPNIPLDSIPELNQPILKECRIFFCHYCNKSYETNSKRKVHILKHHPGAPVIPENAEASDSRACNTVVLTPKKSFAVSCALCPRQYATNAKLLQHHRKHHKQEKARKSKPKDCKSEQKTSEVLVAASLQEDSNPQLIRLAQLNPSVQLLKSNRFEDGDEVYVNVPTSQPVMLEGDFSEEQTLTVLASNADDSFCVALRSGHILSNIGVLCQSEVPYVASASKDESFVTEDGFPEEQINFTTDPAKGNCILTQVGSNSPVLLWQPGIFSNVS